MERNYSDEERYKRAKKRVKDIQGFYWHLFWYLAVNLFLSIRFSFIDILSGDFHELLTINFNTFPVWFFWGIGLAGHWYHVFGKNIVFSKDWEERKIRDFMERDKFGDE